MYYTIHSLDNLIIPCNVHQTYHTELHHRRRGPFPDMRFHRHQRSKHFAKHLQSSRRLSHSWTWWCWPANESENHPQRPNVQYSRWLWHLELDLWFRSADEAANNSQVQDKELGKQSIHDRIFNLFPFWFPQVRWCVMNWTKYSVKMLMGSINHDYSPHFASNEILHMI